jgi:hypothetical protein
MAPIEVRLTYTNNHISQDEVQVCFNNVLHASDAIHNLLTRSVQPKVEFVFSDGVVREVPASFMV